MFIVRLAVLEVQNTQEVVMDTVLFQKLLTLKTVNVVAFHGSVHPDLHKTQTTASVFVKEHVQLDIL